MAWSLMKNNEKLNFPIINRLFSWEVGVLCSNNVGNKVLFHSGKAVLWQFQKINLAETLGGKRDVNTVSCAFPVRKDLCSGLQ